MDQDIRDFVSSSCDLLALGEPTHGEPAFGWIRNQLFMRLVDRGFRSIALETDRVAALTLNEFVRDGVGTLDTTMIDGFSHGFGELDANRELIAWMREYNQDRPPEERLTVAGFDAPMEMASAPSPRRYLEHTRDYLQLDLDFEHLLGDDDQWNRPEAVLDPAMSIGATTEADTLRAHADDMRTMLYARAPELIATSRNAWHNAEIHANAALGLLRYHKQAAQHIEPAARWSRLLATRDALMAQNLLDIRRIEADRAPTLVFANNLHVQRHSSAWRLAERELEWFCAGAIVASLLGERYSFVAGSLGRSESLELGEPHPATYEGLLQRGITDWGLTTGHGISAGCTRTDTTPEQGYFPLGAATLAADAILHVTDGTAASAAAQHEADGDGS